MPRFTYGAASCGNCSATCLNSSSASVLLPERMKPTARSKSALPRAVTCTGADGTAPAVPAVAPAFELCLPAAAGTADVTGCGVSSVGLAGFELQAAHKKV